MFKRILIALDGRPGSQQALKQALVLARLTGASVTALSVEEKLPAYAATIGEVEDAKHEIEAFFARIQATAMQRAKAENVKLETAVRAGNAAQIIVRFAAEGGHDLIVIGADGQRGLGGTADKVAENAPCSVLIARLLPFSTRVKEVMTANVVTVGLSTPLADVAELLIRRGVKAVPVVEQERVVGIITGGDLLRRGEMGLRLSLQRALPAPELTAQLGQLSAQGKVAGDIMTQPVVTILEETAVSEAARVMATKHLKRLPVLNSGGVLVGIVSRTDVLATMTAAEQVGEEFPELPGGARQSASDVMFRDVPIVAPDATLNDVLDRVIATPLRRVVVVDELRHVLGIIVDADLLARISGLRQPGMFQALLARLSHAPVDRLSTDDSAADVMAREVFTVCEDTPLAEVVRIMLDKHVKRLVVVDDEKRLVGMVDRQTVLRAIADEG